MSTESNKALVRRYREIHNNNEMDKLDEVLAQEFFPHTFMPGMPWNGLESARQVHLLGIASFPDSKVTTDDLFAEDVSDLGKLFECARGVSQSDWWGFIPSPTACLFDTVSRKHTDNFKH